MLDGATLVFVEVRYRRSAHFGGGAASVDVQQAPQAGARRAGLPRRASPTRQCACRFDVVEADGDPDAPRLNWLRDAFRADDI